MRTFSNPDNWQALEQRISQRVLAKGLDDEILDVIQNACRAALAEEDVILSREAQAWLLAQVLDQVFAKVRHKLPRGRAPRQDA